MDEVRGDSRETRLSHRTLSSEGRFQEVIVVYGNQFGRTRRLVSESYWGRTFSDACDSTLSALS